MSDAQTQVYLPTFTVAKFSGLYNAHGQPEMQPVFASPSADACASFITAHKLTAYAVQLILVISARNIPAAPQSSLVIPGANG